MRSLLAFTFLLGATTAWAGEERGQTRDNVDDRSLTADQIQRYAAIYYPAIRACYFEHGRPSKKATGEFALHLIVHRDGYIHEVKVDAPGVTGKNLRKLESCLRLEVIGWHFPVRRDFTTAILPYYFLYLDIPGAGPQYSCWNPKGCFSKPARRTTR